MKITSDNKSSAQWRTEWLAKASTAFLVQDSNEWLTTRLAKQFGSYLVAYQPLLTEIQSSLKHHIILNAAKRSDIVCSEYEWPLTPNSVDTVVLQHCLEFSDNPHQLLRAAVECLRPGGHLLLLGINPYSLWGVQYRLGATSSGCSAWRLGRVKDALQVLNMAVELETWTCLRPLTARPKLHRWFAAKEIFANVSGARFSAGAYGIEARKLMQGGITEANLPSSFIKQVMPMPVAASQREKGKH